jgi:hypothetical protein
MNIFKIIKYTLFMTIGFQSSAYGSDAILTLTATGLIVRPPHWENAGNQVITNLNFDFSGVAELGQANKNVDSQLAKAKLVDFSRFSAPITIARPKKCFIGQTSVQDDDVHFIYNGQVFEKNELFQIYSEAVGSYGLRFSKNGNYRDKSGAVSCTTSGSLTYTY